MYKQETICIDFTNVTLVSDDINWKYLVKNNVHCLPQGGGVPGQEQDRDKTRIRQGQDRDKSGARQRKDRDKIREGEG